MKNSNAKVRYWKVIENIHTHGKDKIFSMLWTGVIKGKCYVGNVDVSEMVTMAEKILPYLEDKELLEKICKSCHQNNKTT
jgi:hypothetical protein